MPLGRKNRSISNLLKRWARRSKAAIVLFKIYDNSRLRGQFASGSIETSFGSTHIEKNIAESLTYIEHQFNEYVTYSALAPGELAGKRVLELGSGDSLGVALRFLAAGVSSVVCLDKFYAKRDSFHQTEIYKALRKTLPEEQKRRFDSAIDFERGSQINGQKLKSLHGVTIEEVSEDLERNYHSFDLIVSCAVLEEIYDPEPAFLAMDRLLAPGGYLLHKIDLGDYGIFRDQGMHPLTFLTIAEPIYRLMASDSALPNRKRIGYYREKIKSLGYEAQFFVTSIIGDGQLRRYKEGIAVDVDYSGATLAFVRNIRSRLSREFRQMPDEDLIVDGIFLVARKPS